MSDRNVHYRETQHVTQWWVWTIILLLAVAAWFGFVYQIVMGRPFGSNPAPDEVIQALWLGCGVIAPLLIGVTHLRTTVTDDAIRLRYFPIWGRTIPLSEIESCEARTYRPIAEYTGWGIRYWKGGWAWSVKGNRGVQLRLRGRQPLLIGSKTPEALARAIHAARSAVVTAAPARTSGVGSGLATTDPDHS